MATTNPAPSLVGLPSDDSRWERDELPLQRLAPSPTTVLNVVSAHTKPRTLRNSRPRRLGTGSHSARTSFHTSMNRTGSPDSGIMKSIGPVTMPRCLYALSRM